MKQSEKQAQFLRDVALLIQFASARGDYFTGGELHRPPETQKIFKEQGKSQVNEGQHQKRLAIDLYLFKDGKITWSVEDYRTYGNFWTSLRPENRWGGDFKTLVDAVHFERKD